MKAKQYGVWVVADGNADEAWWELFDSVEDAVSSHGDGTEVYRFEAKLVGTFRRSVKLQRVRRRGKKTRGKKG